MYRKLQVIEKGPDFEKATQVREFPIPTTVKEHELLVKNHYAGVNATDLNAIQNRYGEVLETPYDIGLECLGEVVLVGAAVHGFKVGDWVTVYVRGGYSEYIVAPALQCLPIPANDPDYLALTVSALTAAVSIGELGKPKEGEVALVTAAGGGTGSIAVQLLKHKYKCRVIGTCSSDEKGEFLKSIGCDDYINYKVDEEKLKERVKAVAPDGFHIIYECVGGTLRDVAIEHIAVHGRVIFIGAISGYRGGGTWSSTEQEYFFEHHRRLLLRRSAAASGFLLPHFWSVIPAYFEEVKQLYASGVLKIRIDPNMLTGLEKAAEAVNYLHSGKSYGKVLLKL